MCPFRMGTHIGKDVNMVGEGKIRKTAVTFVALQFSSISGFVAMLLLHCWSGWS